MPVGGVGHDNIVGRQLITVDIQERGEGRRTGLFFALNKKLHSELEVFAQGLIQCGDGC